MENEQSLGLDGYDAVALQKSGKLIDGLAEYQSTYEDKSWRFISAEHRDQFDNNPSTYTPQFEGRCAFAGSLGKTDGPEGQSKNFYIAKNKTFLFSNPVAKQLFKFTFAPNGKFKRALALLAVLLLAVAGYSTWTSFSPPRVLGESQDAFQVPVSQNEDELAIGGYDAVAYFTDAEAKKGDANIAYQWQDTKWLFASESHRQLFAEQPLKYAPQFGGNCAFAAGLGQVVPADPTVWSIDDDRLFLNANPIANVLWRAVPGSAARAYDHWPTIDVQQ